MQHTKLALISKNRTHDFHVSVNFVWHRECCIEDSIRQLLHFLCADFLLEQEINQRSREREVISKEFSKVDNCLGLCHFLSNSLIRLIHVNLNPKVFDLGDRVFDMLRCGFQNLVQLSLKSINRRGSVTCFLEENPEFAEGNVIIVHSVLDLLERRSSNNVTEKQVRLIF